MAQTAFRRGRRHRADRLLAADTRDVDDGSQATPSLERVEQPLASFTGDGAYGQDGVTADIGSRHPDAAVIVPPRSTAVPSEAAETAPTQRDRHLRAIVEHGRTAWQAASGCTEPARAETAMSRFKRVIGVGLRSHPDERRATEVEVDVHVLNRMPDLGRPNSVRVA